MQIEYFPCEQILLTSPLPDHSPLKTPLFSLARPSSPRKEYLL